MTDADGPDLAGRGGDAGGSGDDDPDVFGTGDPLSRPVEPGSPTLENAAFVFLGVASTVALIVHLVSLLG